MDLPDSAAGSEAVRASGRSAHAVLLIVFVTILIDFVGFSVLIPVLPLYAERLGASPHQIGFILTIYALVQLLFLPTWGWVSDRVGRRPVILVSLLGTAVSFLVLAAADDLPTVYLARALAGFFAASIGTAQAVVTDVTSPEERASGMGVIGAAFGVGMILGPVMGGILAALDARAPFYAVAILAVANFGLAWLRLPETRRRDDTPPRWRDLFAQLVPTPLRLLGAVHERRIGLYLYFFFHLFTAFAVLEGLVTLYLNLAHGASEIDVALIFAWIGVVLAVTQGFLLRHLVAVLGEARLVALGLVAMGCGLAAVARAGSLLAFYPIGTLIAFGNAVAFPSFTSLFSRACEHDQAGELMAQSQSMATAGRIVGPIAAGYAMEHFSLESPFWIASAMMFAALVLFQLSRRTLLDNA
jgi:DHA1 family tetracycline resistance protein-like MFS transporter